MILSVCDNPSVLEVIRIIKTVINIIKIVVPIILIVITMIEYMKAITSNDADSLAKSNKVAVNRAIAALLIFLIPTAINIIAKITTNNFEYSKCLTNATSEKITELHKQKMDELITNVMEQRDQDSYNQARRYLSNIKDKELKETYQEELDEIRKELDDKSQSHIDFPEGSLGKTQAKDFFALGDRANNGDKAAQEEWISKIGPIVQKANRFRIKNSLIIAQIIQECGWIKTPTRYNADGSSLAGDNNVLSVNTDMGKPISLQSSAWSKNPQSTQYEVLIWNADHTQMLTEVQSMRKYASIEDCIEDYSNLAYLYHNEFQDNNNLNDYCKFLNGYTPPPAGGDTCELYRNHIQKYNLERYDY